MNSIPKSALTLFGQMGSQTGRRDPVVICRFFREGSAECLYATEYDEIDRLFFGIIVKGPLCVWSYFSLDEIQNSPDVVFDFTFKPCNLSVLAAPRELFDR